jgi:hypothetical protein
MGFDMINRLINFATSSPKLWHLAKGISTVIPASLIAYVAIKWSETPLPFQDQLRTFFEGHLIVTVLCVITPLALPHLFSFIDRGVIKSQERDAANKFISAALISGLNDLVGTKLRRFAEYFRGMNDNQTKADAFNAITQPEAQFVSILTIFHHLLRETTKDDTIQLVLVKISENKTPNEFTVRIPNNLQLPASLLGADAFKTMFHHCARLNRSLVVSNIETHIKKADSKRIYHPTGNPDTDRGSIMCCPLYCESTGKVEFVLSIKSENHNILSDEFKRLYKVPIDAILTRLLLEHHLCLIKRKAL